MSASDLAPGVLIADKYRLVRHLARGGMAEVWLAVHDQLKTEVAIKVVHQGLTQDATIAPLALERFRFEAQISARLGALTRHVVAVQDTGVHEGLPYLVMEYVSGVTLEAEVEQNGPLTLERLADVIDQAADALSAAHSIGVVHRDIKPSNLMLTEAPSGAVLVKVADFGVAKALTRDLPLDRPRETVIGQIVGSPAYMSPEQIRSVEGIDARSDLWSLGVVAYEALTGKNCFEGTTISDLMAAILRSKPEPPSRVRKGVPRTLDAWFARALDQEPARRFASAPEAAAAFRSALAAAPRRRAALIAGAGLLVVAAGVLAIAMSRGGAEAQPAHASTAVATAVSAPDGPVPVATQTAATPATAAVEKPIATASPDRSPPAPAPKHTAAVVSATATAAPAPPPPVTATATVAPPPPPPPPATSAPSKKRIDPSEIQ